jgi:hypothetical protein
MKVGFKRGAADKAARAEAEAVVQRWNHQLALGRDLLWSPTIRAALVAGTFMVRGVGTDAEADWAVRRAPQALRAVARIAQRAIMRRPVAR